MITGLNKKKMWPTKALGILCCLSLLLAGCASQKPPAEEIPLVRTLTITSTTAGQTVQYPGEVRGRYETQLAFQVSGKISKRNVDSGTVVRKGDVLMEIDTKDIEQAVNMSLAQLNSAQSQLRLAQANLERFQKLYEQGAVSKMQLDQYQGAYEVAAAAVQQAAALYSQGMNQLGYSQLRADADGVVAGVYAEAGQVVSAGQPVVTLVKGDEREIEISVPENSIDEIRNAKQIEVSFWALPGITVGGKIREISPVADSITKTYKVRISLSEPPSAVKLGMTAAVTITKATAGQTAIFIPLAAIYQTGDTPHVWVVKDGMVTLRPIKVGAVDYDQVQVLEGLREGDIIVTAGVQKLREGQKVRLL